MIHTPGSWLVVGTLTAHYVLIVHLDVLMSIIANVQCVHQQWLHWPDASMHAANIPAARATIDEMQLLEVVELSDHC